MANKSKNARPPGFTAERAKFWGISERVCQQWLAKGVPLDDVAKMVAWYAALPTARQSRISAAFQRRIIEERIAADRRGEAGAKIDDDFAAFEKQYQAGAESDQTALADLKKQFAFYLYKERQCSLRQDGAGAAEAMRQIKELSSVIHDMELRAQRLGRDLGDLVPRQTLEQPARFLGYHLLRCADASITEITRALTVADATSAPLLPEEIRARIEPILLTAYILRPLERAMSGDNTAAPPDWLVNAIRSGAAEFIEGAILDRIATPALPA